MLSPIQRCVTLTVVLCVCARRRGTEKQQQHESVVGARVHTDRDVVHRQRLSHVLVHTRRNGSVRGAIICDVQ